MPFFIATLLLMFGFGGFFYNGRNLDLTCTSINSEARCNYETTFLGLSLQSGKNEKLLNWKEGKYSIHFYFEKSQISLGFIGAAPKFPTLDESNNEKLKDGLTAPPFQFSYRPFSIWIVWLFCFIPSGGSILFTIYFLKEWFKKI